LSNRQAYSEAKQKLKNAFVEILDIDKEERIPQDHEDKRLAFSVALSHYTSQAASYKRYIYDQKNLARQVRSKVRKHKKKNRLLVPLSERISGRSFMG
jgi:hypothetical protein